MPPGKSRVGHEGAQLVRIRERKRRADRCARPCSQMALKRLEQYHVKGLPVEGPPDPQHQSPSRHQDTDRKSTRLNSSHGYISYAVFCLKKKKTKNPHHLNTGTL